MIALYVSAGRKLVGSVERHALRLLGKPAYDAANERLKA